MNVFDLFCGVGGLSYGFYKDPFFKVLGANEIDEETAKAYSLNHPDTKMFSCDIKELNEENLKEFIGKIDIILGGPPCQSYSIAGLRQMDEKAFLFKEYKKVLNILKPKYFVFENVTGLLSMDNKKLFPLIQEEFKELGYTLKYKVIDTADYGVPQHRKRIILVGQFGDTNDFIYPEPTHGKENYVTVEQAIGDLPPLQNNSTLTYYAKEPDNDFLKFVRDNENDLTEYTSSNHSPRILAIMQAMSDGGTQKDIPEELRPGGFENRYAKLWSNRPSGTITTKFYCPPCGRFTHPRDSRGLTIREGARLQSFPDSYQFYGSKKKKATQIGNAVPPLFSVIISNSFKTLEG